jgi:Xaa-Pro dipeptidase
MTQERLSFLIAEMKNNRLDTIAINPGASLLYLTGLHFHLMERPVVLLIRPSTTSVLVVPQLEAIKVKQSTIPLSPVPYGDDPREWSIAFLKAIQILGFNGNQIGVEPTQFRFLEMDYLKTASPEIEFVSAESVLGELRLKKDGSEIAAMRKAVQIAEAALKTTVPSIKIGMTEQQIASELTIQLLKAGSESTLPFEPIVASGSNSANPHAVPTERKLQKGDLLVIDWGATYQGYISDLTRSFAVGELIPEFSKIANTVYLANRAGCSKVKPGISAGEIDLATRKVISDAGYGSFFTHRTGHGIGMQAHEAPYIFSGNETTLEPGMSFTIEPGIYLPGKGGIRIEDNVVVTPQGMDVLSTLDREIQVIG